MHRATRMTQALVFASKETGQEVNVEKTKYMAMSRDQNEVTIRRFIKVPLRGWKSSGI